MRRFTFRSIRGNSGKRASRLRLLLLSGLILAWPRSGEAQTNATWLGGNGQWNSANWSTGTPPNNSGSTTYSVFIDNGLNDNAVVTIGGINPTISNLTVDSGNTLIVGDNQSLTIAGGAGAGSLAIAGTLNIGSGGATTDLILSGAGSTITLSGGGTLSLSNSFSNRIYGDGTETLVNSAGNTIQGSGQIGINSGGYGFILNNQGVIDANQSSTLQIATSNPTANSGTLEATGGGTLSLIGTFNNSSAGTILSSGAGSVVSLDGATVSGGTLTTTAGGTMDGGGATLNNLTISAGTTITTQDNTLTAITGSVVDKGTIAVASSGDTTSLQLQGGASLEVTSGGSIVLSGSPGARIYGTGSDTLTVDSGGTIQGQGQVGINQGGYGFNLVNNGTIDANVSGAALSIAPSNTAVNTSLIEATNGATLNLGGSFNNAGGTIEAAGAGSIVNLAGTGSSTISGGTLTTTAGGAMYGNGSTLENLTISAGTTVTTTDNASMTLSGSVADKGTIALTSAGDTTSLYLNGAAVEVTGGGSITLSGNFANRILGTGTETLTVDSGGTIQGQGQVGINQSGYGFTLTNNGTIDANVSGGTLQVAPTSTATNTGVMEATGGGTLVIAAPVTNTGATIEAVGAGSIVSFNGGGANGGLVEATGGGTLSATGSTLTNLTIDAGGVMTSANSTFGGVTIDAGTTIQVQDNTLTAITGSVVDKGTIAVASSGDTTSLQLQGGASLEVTSGGSIALSGSPNARIYGTGSDTLTVDSGGTIQGQGQVGINQGGYDFTLVNKGTVDANVAGATLSVIPTNTVTNTGLMEATNGGTLSLAGTFDNAGGTILATGTSSVVALSGTISGGTLTTTAGGTMDGGGATLDSLTISAGSTVTTQDNTQMGITGSVVDKGTIAIASSGDTTSLQLQGGASLEVTSGGSIVLSGSPGARIYGTGSDTLTVDSGGTIQGQGQVGINQGGYGFNLVNNGTIGANVSGATLSIAPSNTVTNAGLIEATNGATLNLGGTFNNAGGTIEAAGANSVVNLAGTGSSTIVGGTLTTTGGGVINNDGTVTLNGVTIGNGSRLDLLDNTTTTLSGTITNNGTVAQGSAGDTTNIQLSGPVTLAGTGTLAMSNESGNRIYGITGDAALTNGAGHTIEGAGQIGINNGGYGFAFTNNGTVLANQSTELVIAPSSPTINNGTLQVNGGSTLEVLGGLSTGGTVNVGQPNAVVSSLLLMGDGNDYVQNGGTTTLWTSGSNLQLQSGHAVQLEGGTLQGLGTVTGDLVNSGGTVMPGLPGSIGTLTVTGSYSDPIGGQFDVQIDISGSSMLNVGGTADLTGTTLDVGLLGGFTPGAGSSYEIIATAGGVSGMFTDPAVDIGGLTFTAVIRGDDVYLEVTGAAVPEPGSLLLLAAGLGGMGAGLAVRARRRGARVTPPRSR